MTSPITVFTIFLLFTYLLMSTCFMSLREKCTGLLFILIFFCAGFVRQRVRALLYHLLQDRLLPLHIRYRPQDWRTHEFFVRVQGETGVQIPGGHPQ